MAFDASVYEQIEKYISNEMEPPEKQAFEDALNRDPSLMETLMAYKKLNEEYSGIEQSKAGEEALNATLQTNRKAFFKEEAAKKPAPVRKMIFALAAAASLIAAFFLLKPVLFTTGNKDLFSSYYEDEQYPISRGTTDSAAEAGKFYNEKNYEKALEILELYTKGAPGRTQEQVFTAKSYLETSQYAKADSVFDLVAKGTTMFSEKAQWLHALSLLKQKRNDESKQMLQQIPESSFYSKQAKKLLGEF